MSQNTFKALALGAVLGFLVSVVPSCGGGTPTTCGPSNCLTGCCNANKCVTGTNGNNTTCGTAGLACVDCTKTTGSSCTSAFKCSGTGTGGGTGGTGGTGGGTATGGGTGGSGGGSTLTCAQTCATGCCDSSGVCQAGTANTACGTGAAACTSCASPATCVGNVCKDTTCANCVKNGVCQTALTDTACGKGGVTCLDCAAAGGATCNTTTGVCAGGTCPSGCRNAAGACVTGNTNSACGTTGGACTACTGTNVCTNGACVASGTGGGAGGGGGSGGGSGGTCSGGAPCSNGCCSGTVCIAPTFQSATNCGINAAACSPCQTGQLCTAGVCGGGTGGGAGGGGGSGGGGGGPAGVLGAACTLDTDCTGVTVTTAEAAQGYKAFCKKTLNPVGLPYPGGMCTRRCIPTSANPAPCGSNGFCDYTDGPYGEIDNICLPTCSQASPCRTGYKCYQYTSTLSACYPANSDGSDIGPFDAGPGNMGNVAGGPCTSDTQCAPQTPPPALGFCLTPTNPDGGPSGFLDGQCSAQCNFSLSDAWCGTSGACNPFIGGATATGPAIVFLCQQECTGADAGITSTCRTGYFCNAASNGACSPRCDNLGATCPSGTTCNTTTGACQ